MNNRAQTNRHQSANEQNAKNRMQTANVKIAGQQSAEHRPQNAFEQIAFRAATAAIGIVSFPTENRMQI